MKNTVENTKKYVADFETLTLTDEEIKQGKNTYVWAWAITDTDNVDNVFYGTDIKSFIKHLAKLNSGSYVYFHNLKFDGNFIINYLLQNNFVEVPKQKFMPEYSFTALVSELGTWYNIIIKFKKTTIKIYDSYKKLPFSVDKLAKDLGYEEGKGKIDYHEYRAEGGKLSNEDKDYIRRDVQIVAKALKDVCFSKGLYGMTIGSDCMNMYKETCPKFNELFVELPKNIDEFCREAYKGGYCYVNPKYQEKLHKISGSTYDYNSMYPSVMVSPYKYPYGEPVYYSGMYEKIPFYPLFIQHFKAAFILKEGYVPTVQIKNNICYRDTEYLNEVLEPVELYMTNIDFDIFVEHYDVVYFEPIDGYAFRACAGMFDKYINYWYKFKEEATLKGDKVERLLAKLALNNLGGKFGTNTNATKQSFRVENDVLRHSYITEEKKSVYVPVAAFMTSYARQELFKAIQANYDVFCYCDTDSVHILAEEAKGLKVHDSALGHWKKESTWTAAKFLRQKTYAEFINGKWEIKGCGMNDEVKANVKDINDFKINAEFSGKKITKHVKGGIVIRETTFKILPI